MFASHGVSIARIADLLESALVACRLMDLLLVSDRTPPNCSWISFGMFVALRDNDNGDHSDSEGVTASPRSTPKKGTKHDPGSTDPFSNVSNKGHHTGCKPKNKGQPKKRCAHVTTHNLSMSGLPFISPSHVAYWTVCGCP